MPQSLAHVLVHLVFSTKGRYPWLTPEVREELYPYLTTVLDEMGCPATAIGGVTDHVHLLFSLARTTSMAGVVENVKTSSSKWLKTKGPTLESFYWQIGYGAFSVSQSNRSSVARYIRDQEAHHRTASFQDEYRKLLHRHQVVFDEEYVWD